MDLFRDLRDIPKNAAVRRVNEMVKRARTCKVHYRIRCRMLYLSHTLPHAIPIAYAAACYRIRRVNEMVQRARTCKVCTCESLNSALREP